MQRLTPDNWVTLVILAAIVTAAMLAVYLPQAEELQALRHRMASLRLAMDADAKKASVVPNMVLEVDAMKRRYKGFDRRMPKRKELGGFLREISSILASE